MKSFSLGDLAHNSVSFLEGKLTFRVSQISVHILTPQFGSHEIFYKLLNLSEFLVSHKNRWLITIYRELNVLLLLSSFMLPGI